MGVADNYCTLRDSNELSMSYIEACQTFTVKMF